MENVGKEPDHGNPFRAMVLTSLLGADMAIPVVGGYFVGTWLDGKAGTSPLFLVLAILLGMAVGIYAIIKHVTAFTSEKSKK